MSCLQEEKVAHPSGLEEMLKDFLGDGKTLLLGLWFFANSLCIKYYFLFSLALLDAYFRNKGFCFEPVEVSGCFSYQGEKLCHLREYTIVISIHYSNFRYFVVVRKNLVSYLLKSISSYKKLTFYINFLLVSDGKQDARFFRYAMVPFLQLMRSLLVTSNCSVCTCLIPFSQLLWIFYFLIFSRKY